MLLLRWIYRLLCALLSGLVFMEHVSKLQIAGMSVATVSAVVSFLGE